jgi:alpha-mannosidase
MQFLPLLLTLALCLPLAAQQKRIYIAPDDHTDYMWTGNEEQYRAAFVEMLDYYLDLADKTKSNSPEHQSRWHCDGTIWFSTYEKNKSPREFQRLIEQVRSGHVSVPLNTLVSTYGGTPAEAVLRGMYYAGTLERRFNLRIPLAIAMENQTLPYGLGALWAGSGAKYSWKGICGCLTKFNRTTRRPHEIYWWKGADDSRILMKWNSMFNGNSGSRTMGGYAEAREPAKEVEFVDSNPAFREAYPFPVIGVFGKGWDDLKTLTDEFVTTAKAKTTPARKVIVSNVNDFFADFEKNHARGLPDYNAAFGNEWDLYTASVTEISSRVRRAVEKLRGAEALAAMVSRQRPEFMAGREAARSEAWLNLGLYWEHNWTADGRWVSRQERADWGRRMADGVDRYVDRLHADAAYALGGLIAGGGGKNRFYVFNPLSWTRTDAAEIVFDAEGPVHVVDLIDGKETPSQYVESPGDAQSFQRRRLRILAKDLPPLGYKVFEIRAGKGAGFSVAAQVNGRVVENAVYRVTVEDRGAISGLVDKTRGDRDFAGRQDRRHLMNDLGLDPGVLEVENVGPVSVTMRARGESPVKHTSRITLYRDSRRIDIRNDIEENFGATHAWSFAVNLTAPDVWHEEVGAVIRAKLTTEGGHYSPVMSRLEWLTLNHFADISGNDGAGVTLSNHDLAFMKLGNSEMVDGVSRLDTATPQIKILAGGQIDAPQAGIPAQGGDRHFLQRFALRTHGGFDPVDAMKFALEHQNPPAAGWLRNGAAAYPEKTYSMLTVSNPNVLVWSWKPAEDGVDGAMIARVWNLSPKPQDYSLTLTGGLAAAKRVTHIETDLEPVPVTAGRVDTQARASQMQTFRLTPPASSRP